MPILWFPNEQKEQPPPYEVALVRFFVFVVFLTKAAKKWILSNTQWDGTSNVFCKSMELSLIYFNDFIYSYCGSSNRMGNPEWDDDETTFAAYQMLNPTNERRSTYDRIRLYRVLETEMGNRWQPTNNSAPEVVRSLSLICSMNYRRVVE